MRPPDKKPRIIGSVVDPDPNGSETFDWIRIQQNMKEQINKNVISLEFWNLCNVGLYYEKENEFKVVLFTIYKYT